MNIRLTMHLLVKILKKNKWNYMKRRGFSGEKFLRFLAEMY